jgi:hypothetical protein
MGFFKRALAPKLDGVTCKEAAEVQVEACGSWMNVIDKTNESIASSEQIIVDAMTNVFDNIYTKGKEELIEHQRQRVAWLKGIVDYAEEKLDGQRYHIRTKLYQAYAWEKVENRAKIIEELEETALSLGVDLERVDGYQVYYKK